MKRTRTRRPEWLDRQGKSIPYELHPGRFLAVTEGWQYNTTAYSLMPGPEPDVVNIAFLARRPIEIEHLDYTYHARPRMTEPYWINFGYHSDPLSVVRANWQQQWIGYWIKPTLRQPRIWREPAPESLLYSRDLPQEHRWRFIQQWQQEQDK